MDDRHKLLVKEYFGFAQVVLRQIKAGTEEAYPPLGSPEGI